MTIQDCCHPRLVWKFMTEDIVVIARDLKLPPEKVQHAVELLDAGNTIPFIARFRKDQTGGLDPEQVLAIKQ
ncbi:MAG: Tex-like N-terminal domain-containing protein, partial [Planctomycetota bacterium]